MKNLEKKNSKKLLIFERDPCSYGGRAVLHVFLLVCGHPKFRVAQFLFYRKPEIFIIRSSPLRIHVIANCSTTDAFSSLADAIYCRTKGISLGSLLECRPEFEQAFALLKGGARNEKS